MDGQGSDRKVTEIRGHSEAANASLHEVAPEAARLWRRHHLDDGQTKHVVEHARKSFGVRALQERRRTVDRLDQHEVERLNASWL